MSRLRRRSIGTDCDLPRHAVSAMLLERSLVSPRFPLATPDADTRTQTPGNPLWRFPVAGGLNTASCKRNPDGTPGRSCAGRASMLRAGFPARVLVTALPGRPGFFAKHSIVIPGLADCRRLVMAEPASAAGPAPPAYRSWAQGKVAEGEFRHPVFCRAASGCAMIRAGWTVRQDVQPQHAPVPGPVRARCF